VGQTIAWIVAPGETPPKDSAFSTPVARGGSHTQSQPNQKAATPAAEPSATPASAAKVSPKARRLAKELGVDLSRLRGSGAGGEILASDIQSAAAGPAAAAPSPKIEVLSSFGRIMAERTAQSWSTVPHFFVSREVEATALDDYRERILSELESKHQVRITHTDLLVALVAKVLLKHPRLNASWSADGIKLHDHVNLGIAIAVNDGVVAAVIHNAHTATLSEIAKQRRDVAERARARKLRPTDIADATFTISNLGMYEVDQFTTIITPPQAAILAIGSIGERVIAVQGKPAVRPMMTLTLSCDHRVVDGARAAQFLIDLSEAIGDAQKMLS
jgi:pyruvate dehydrogenase E2 component (dihydrolipoamide acetyltransferase)